MVRRQLIGLAVIAACAGELEDPDRFSFDVPRDLIAPKCGRTDCHDVNGTSAALDLVSPNIADRLVGVPGTFCTTSTLVNASSVSASLLLIKVRPFPPCGDRMPLFATEPLTDEEISFLEGWVRGLVGTSSSAMSTSSW